MTENLIQKQILDYLKLKKIWHRRFNTGMAKMGGRYVHFGSPGCPDILASTNNSIIWIEVKQQGKYLTPLQKQWREETTKLGHTFITARCVEDVMALFENVPKNCTV